MMFDADRNAALGAPLSRAAVKTRQQGGRSVSYVEGWHVIAEANRIFGFGGWSSETLDILCVNAREREIGEAKRPGWGVTYTARVRITIDDQIARDGVGAGHGIDVDLGQAHESAIKEAETDARKRALMTFGNVFGLALYDKAQTHVVDEPDPSQLRFIAECKASIERLSERPGDLLAWWRSEPQRKARRDFLSRDDVEELKMLIIACLPQGSTDGPS